MSHFTSYVMVDWSAASTPTRDKDSIWIAAVRRRDGSARRIWLSNPRTRQAATEELIRLLVRLAAEGRVLVGFDFPFGYPAGFSAALNGGGSGWRAIWQRLASEIQDGPGNANNRFDVAEEWNRRISGEPFPFWGNARNETRACLTRKRFRRHEEPGDSISERRLCEIRVPRAQPVWKLAYAGSVGSQILMGIPKVWAIRNDPKLKDMCAIWPFETGLADNPDDGRQKIVLAEIYPSLVRPLALGGKPKDAGQVAAVAGRLAELDAVNRLAPLFGGDPALTRAQRERVIDEEAWILGVVDQPRLAEF